MISFLCTECDAPLKAKTSRAGQQVKCPACGHHVEIPDIADGLSVDGEDETAGVPTRKRGKRAPAGVPTGDTTPAPAPQSTQDPFDENDRQTIGFWVGLVAAVAVGILAHNLSGNVFVTAVAAFVSFFLGFALGSTYASGVVLVMTFAFVLGIVWLFTRK